MRRVHNAASELLDRVGASCEGKTAYLHAGGTLSYGELRGRARRFAGFFAAQGVAPGERVLLVLPDSPAFPAAFLGAMLAGACPVAVNTFLKPEDYAFFATDSGSRLLLTVEGHAAAAAASADCPAVVCDGDGPQDLQNFAPDFAPLPAADDALGFMLYSSGSTGRPKGVPHRQADLLRPAATWGPILGLGPADVVLSSSKLFFAYGLLASLVLPLSAGAATVLFPGKPGPYDIYDLMAAHRPTAFFGVPTLYNAMIRAFEPAMKESVTPLCVSAGEALPALLFEEWERLTGSAVLDGIGSTESCNVFICNPREERRPGSVGRVVPGFEARLVDDEGRDVPAGAKGHLLVRGESFCRGYWNRPDKDRETMLPDGWVRTGDVFEERDGWYYHQGRSDDMLKSGGQWVSPVQVEEALLRHPAVAECAVAACRVGGLDLVCAFVVPAGDAKPGKALTLEWRGHLLRALPEHMCPARFECVAELPKTATGKVQRFRLRGN
ncbi:benzoate-CoA ligase family [Desulfovibrio sp. X2]|uniref:benzoate-CoA ligase family protein n=1 Tax=Desulfovibrio sp. X2 TaxID=941449 RepID=UPI000358B14D|nr:benzoate-CoA ligase family protein [Desulfovibrio sp. X2]EPR37689.1 benzoate-CoA ligase family [Desulfovibrio sp. X2]